MFHVHRVLVFHVATLIIVARGLPKLISVPDLHGDYERAVQVLEAAGVMDARSGAWSGGSTTLVQTGDIVDRGPDSLKIYKLFARLATEAPKQGGEVVNLLGNHELMNMQGDFRYVNKDEMRAAGGQDGWQGVWQPDAEIGQQVRKFKTAAKVGSVLFVHAGLLPTFLENGRSLEDLNSDMATALADNANLESKLLGNTGPCWTRFYAEKNSQEACKALAHVLKTVGAERMVVGHSIQERGPGEYRANSACGGSLILGDTAISRAYGGEVSFIEYTTAGEAVVNYPGLGIKEVFPSLQSSPQDSGPTTKKNLRAPRPIEEPGNVSRPLEEPGTVVAPPHRTIYTIYYSTVFCLLIFGVFFAIRLWARQPKKFSASERL
jgi:hypothetical protein